MFLANLPNDNPVSWTLKCFLTLVGAALLLQFGFLRLEEPEWLTPKAYSLLGWALGLSVLLGAALLFLSAWFSLWRGRGSMTRALGVTICLAIFLCWARLAAPAFLHRHEEAGVQHFMNIVEANENSVRNLLKKIHKAAEAFRQRGLLDADGNGLGEYGDLQMLALAGLLPEELQAMETVEPYQAADYVFYLYLPADIRQAEQKWCLYAWPLTYGQDGRHSYFIHETGRLYSRDESRFQGPDREDGPAPFEAYFPGFSPGQDKDFSLMAAFRESIAENRWSPVADQEE